MKSLMRVATRWMRFTSKVWPDKIYVKCYCFLVSGCWINLNSPKTFNEKLCWMKLNYRHPDLWRYADKYEAKKIVAERVGKEYVIPSYGVYNKFDDINFDKMPSTFILKCTHDSGSFVICRDKSEFDKNHARKVLEKGLKRNYYYNGREWPYKNIPPRIVADTLLDDKSGHELRDYKWWCFNGVPKIMYCTNKAKNFYENFYDMDFKPLPISHGFRRNIPDFEKPSEFEKMKQLAGILAKDLPFVRIDFYDVNGRIYFGEFTFYDWGGNAPIKPREWSLKLGDWIILPKPVNPYKHKI